MKGGERMSYAGCPKCGYVEESSGVWKTCPNCKKSALYDINQYDLGIDKSDLGIEPVHCMQCGEFLGYEDEYDQDELDYILCASCEE
jgi:predicted Zn-ribbon and HTH transcriptional regulator